VSLTSPVGGASYVAPATLTLSASASDPGGSISKVSFYSGAQLVGSVASSPYQLTWSSVPSGNYALTAVALDNSGLSTTSNQVSVSVAAPTTQAQLSFTPSVDNSTDVTSYQVNVFPWGTSTSVASQNLGMPAIVNNTVTVDISALAQGLPSGNYFGTVTAVGPGGSATSQPSNMFTR
jgi:predicted phage tail protein